MLLKGEDSWAYLVGDAALGITCFRNDHNGCTLELPKGNSTGSFTFQESDTAVPQKCWLRDLSLQPSKLLSSKFTMNMFTMGEGERFPDKAQDLIEGLDEYWDDPLRGFAEWRICSRYGHILLEGRWGVRVWLVHDGFLVTSDILDRGLVVRSEIRLATSEEVKEIIDWHRIAPWIPMRDGTSSLSGSTQLEDNTTDQQDLSDFLTDNDLERVLRWLPPSEVQTPTSRTLQLPQAGQTHSAAPLHTPAARGQSASESKDQGGMASFANVAASRSEKIFPAGKRRASTNTLKAGAVTENSLKSLQRLCRDGIISVEQLEQLSAKARAEEWQDLLTQLSPYARTHSLEHFVAFRTTLLEHLNEERRKAEERWQQENASAYEKHEEAAQNVVGELLFAERMKREMFPEDVQDGEEEDEEEVSLKLKHLRADVTKARLRVEAEETEFQKATEKRVAEQKRLREGHDRRVAEEAARIEQAKEDLEVARRGDGDKAREAKIKEMNTILQRPRAEHRKTMNNISSLNNPCPMNAKGFAKNYKLLLMEEGKAMLDTTLARNWGEDAEVTAPERRKSFVIAEHGELVGGSKAKVTLPKLNVNLAASYTEERALKKRLAAIENSKLLKGTRKVKKDKRDSHQVMDMLLAEREQEASDAMHEASSLPLHHKGSRITPVSPPVFTHCSINRKKAQSSNNVYQKAHNVSSSSTSRLPALSRPSSQTALSFLSLEDRRFLLSAQMSELDPDVAGQERGGGLPDISLSSIGGASRASDLSISRSTSLSIEEAVDRTGSEGVEAALGEEEAKEFAREVKRRRAVRDASLEMERAAGTVQKREFEHDGFDFRRSKRVVDKLVQKEIPHVQAVWTHTWDLSEEFLDAMSTLASPRRRPLWRAVCEVDAVLGPVMRDKQATLLQCAYKIWVAKEALRERRKLYFLAMVVRVQCNTRMCLARRAIPKRLKELADAIAAEKAAEERRKHVERVGELPLKDAMELPDDDKVVWIQLKVDVTEALIKRLLKLCDGDVGRALMLAQNAKKRADSKKQLV